MTNKIGHVPGGGVSSSGPMDEAERERAHVDHVRTMRVLGAHGEADRAERVRRQRSTAPNTPRPANTPIRNPLLEEAANSLSINPAPSAPPKPAAKASTSRLPEFTKL